MNCKRRTKCCLQSQSNAESSHICTALLLRTSNCVTLRRISRMSRQACATELDAGRAAWRLLAALPGDDALSDPRAVAFLAGVGEVLVAAAIVRATARAHQVR